MEIFHSQADPLYTGMTNMGLTLANEKRRCILIKNKMKLLSILKSPPSDFDGSNKKLSLYMKLHQRTVARLLAALRDDGSLKIETRYRRSYRGGVYADRWIQVTGKN